MNRFKTRSKFIYFFFRILRSRVTSADFPCPFDPIFCILLRHFSRSHVLFHHIHKPPFWPSLFPLSWQFHPQHPSPNIPVIFPPYMSITPQSCFSCFLFKPLSLPLMYSFLVLSILVTPNILTYFALVKLFCHQRRVDIQSDVCTSPNY